MRTSWTFVRGWYGILINSTRQEPVQMAKHCCGKDGKELYENYVRPLFYTQQWERIVYDLLSQLLLL